MTNHPSPFLPGANVQFAWDSTSLGWLKECPRKYYFSMICGYRSKGESVHLRFGILYHNGLELFDKLRADGLSPEDALREVVSKALYDTWDYERDADGNVIGLGGPWTPDHTAKTRETLIRSLIWYIDHFSHDPAQTVILSNGKPAVELSFRMELDYGPTAERPYVLCGHLDRVVEFAGGTYVMDRKTASSTISSAYFDQYDPDNQMSLYTMAAKVIYETPVKGVIIDAVQIAVGFSRYQRGFTFRTDAQIEEWLDDTKSWLGLAAHYATEGRWPANDKSCHKYGGCTFRKVCQKSPEVRQKFLDSDYIIHKWNPLEVR